MASAPMSSAYKILTDALRQGVLLLDGDGRLAHANPAARRCMRLGNRLSAGQPVRPWLRTTLGLSVGAVDRLMAGETVAAVPPAHDGGLGQLRLTRALLPAEVGTPWTAIVMDDRRADVRAPASPATSVAIAESHRMLWRSFVAAVERGYEQSVAVAVFTVLVEPPVEVGALCRMMAEAGAPGDVVGFVDPASDPQVLPTGSVCAAVVSPGCVSLQAGRRCRALTARLAEGGWAARVGVAVLRTDTDAAGTWHAEERARAVLRLAVATSRTVDRARRDARSSAPDPAVSASGRRAA